MAANKIIGYILSVLGLIAVASSSTTALSKISKVLPFMASIKPLYLIIAGAVLLIGGVLLIMSKEGVKHAAEEVPIYEGVGRKRKIVGYRKS